MVLLMVELGACLHLIFFGLVVGGSVGALACRLVPPLAPFHSHYFLFYVNDLYSIFYYRLTNVYSINNMKLTVPITDVFD